MVRNYIFLFFFEVIFFFILLFLGDNVFIDGKFQWLVKCEDFMWFFEGGKYIIVNLDKIEERFWIVVLEGDVEIDKIKVDII